MDDPAVGRRPAERASSPPTHPRLRAAGVHRRAGCELRAMQIQDVVSPAPRARGAFHDQATLRRRAGTVFVVAVSCVAPGRPASAPRWAPDRARSGLDLRLVELPLCRHQFLVEAGNARGDGSSSASSEPRAATAGARRRRSRARAGLHQEPRWMPAPRAARRQPGAALGRDRESLPVVRQLHARLPDLLLRLDRGRQRRERRARRALAALGLLLQPRVQLSPRRRGPRIHPRALPAMDDAQAQHVVRSVRLVGLRGCGRCITWCPVGIDLTEEVGVLRRSRHEDPRPRSVIGSHPFFARTRRPPTST